MSRFAPVSVPALLSRCSAVGLQVRLRADGTGLRLEAPEVPPAELVREVRSAGRALLSYLKAVQNAEEETGGPVSAVASLGGVSEWQGDPALYGADALPRRHAPPSSVPPLDRPHASPVKLCGNCSKWTADQLGAEMGDCAAGWNAHGIAPLMGMTLPSTSRGSRCWASQGRGWRLRRASEA